MTDFDYTELLPVGEDTTQYRQISSEGVSTFEANGETFLKVEPEALRLLTATAMRDIAHYLRPAHLEQLRSILDDPEASANDVFVATELLQNANIAAGGVLPMCQDTGTAIVVGKKGQQVWTGVKDEEYLSRGIFDTYAGENLRYSQTLALNMYEEKNSGTNLPAQIEIYAEPGDQYELLFVAKGGGSANKTFLYQESKALLNPETLLGFVAEKIRTLGTSACPPYHLALVIGGSSAEFTLKTVKLASCHYLDELPTTGNASGRAFRDRDLEEKVLKLCAETGIGAQFGLASLDRSASLRTSSAPTANPSPCSPARAASIAAFSASRLVWLAISLIT